MNIYLLSGLGADDWIYQNLTFPKGYNVHFIPWLEPEENEDLVDYVHRMASSIDGTQAFILCGVSFGGICAQEISRFLKPEKLILISTVTSRKEKPAQMNLGSDLGLSHVMPAAMFKWAAVQSSPVLGIYDKGEIAAFREMAERFSPEYYKWAVTAIGKWLGGALALPTLRLHGDKDKIFPIEKIEGALEIEGGEHIMVLHRGAELSKIIANFLAQ